MLTFAIYCRASEETADGLSSDPYEQEAEGRALADRLGLEVSDVVMEVASGSLSAEDRKLGELIKRCESGELAGVIVRDEKRFARDVVAGGVALKRLTDCGARLLATWSSFDSEHLSPESMLTFNIMLAVGQAELERNRLRRVMGKDKAASRGVWCSSVPVGYDRGDDGRLTPNDDADTVRKIFHLRAEGMGFSEIAREIPPVVVRVTRLRGKPERKQLTRSGVGRVVRNRTYLGEQRIPVKEHHGEPKVLAGNHQALVTSGEFEAANAVKNSAPARRGYGAETSLHGLVRCGVCGGKMHVLAYGTGKRTFACTKTGCAGLMVSKVEQAVRSQLERALIYKDPHVGAVIDGDTRYTDALAEVDASLAALAEYRDDIELQKLLGVRDFASGLKVRKEAVETARRALRELPRPQERDGIKYATAAEYTEASERKFMQRVIAEVLVFPRSAPDRIRMRWTGSDESFVAPIVVPQAMPVATAA